MSSANWTACTGVLGTNDCARGVTSGPTKPNGGGTFLYAMNSITNTVGGLAFYTAQVSFAPMSSGCDISGAVKRGPSGGTTGFSAFLFVGLGGTALTDEGYMLGISDANPGRIELRKGALSVGLPDEAPGGVNKILRRSTESVAIDVWTHLRLEQVVNANGDVILNCYKSDLVANAVTAPVWVAIPGMDPYTDDALGIASGSFPKTSGRAGFGGQFSDVTRRCYFDHLVVKRQT
ncbi:MAG: hypothetical protein HOV80_17580 [Polyangiaceae bacterium]|nr:hypothetical protein [Polyangiaceae bacterium]